MSLTISVIIAAYDHLEEVLMCLCALQRTASGTVQIEFLIADDASPNIKFPLLIPYCSAKVVRRDVNGGFAANCNSGASQAQGDILFMVNQDIAAAVDPATGVILSQDWDIHLANAFADPAVGIVGAKLLFPDGRIQNAGGQFDGKCQPFHIGLGYSNIYYDEVNTPREVSWTTAAAIAVRRELFNQLGGFDEAYGRGYFEDVEIAVKARLAGFKVWYEPRCTFIHSVGTSGGSPMFAKNAALFRERWVDTKIVQPDTLTVKERFW